MEFRRVATSVIRSHASPSTLLLTPSSTTSWTIGMQMSCRRASNRPTGRCLSTTRHLNASKPTTTTTSTPEEASTIDLQSVSEELGWSARPSRSRSSPLSNRGGQLSQEEKFNGGSSADSILSALNGQLPSLDRGSSAPSSSFNRNSGIDLSRMKDPAPAGGAAAGTSRAADIMSGIYKDTAPGPMRLPIALKPRTGRTVEVNANIDVGRAFRLMEQSCARNKVRSDATKQRFHERPGLKRKRLRRERWRKKFMEGFKATVGRVKQLRNQGW